MEEEGDILRFDTGCVRNSTIIRRAWHFFKQIINSDYWDTKIKNEGKVYPIVNAVTKLWIHGRDLPVLVVNNQSTLLDDSYET